MMPGGLSEARPATPEIQEIADSIRPELERQTNTKYEQFEATVYKSQVVAGFIYYIKVNVGGDCFIHVKVLQGISSQNQDFELLDYQTNKSKNDEITYF